MDALVITLVLGSALMHAAWNYLIKAGQDKLLDSTTFACVASALALPLLPFLPAPNPAAWPWLGCSVLLHVAYFLALVKAYQASDLSLAYPVMRGLAPAMVTLVSVALGRELSTGVMVGVVLVVSGVVLPAALSIWRTGTPLASLKWAAGNAVLIATYTLVDAQGVNASGSAASYTAWLFFLDAFLILGVALWRRGQSTWAYMAQRWRGGVAASVLSMTSYGVVLWAMTVAPVPAVASLRESSVVFAALLGGTLLKEKDRATRMGGAVLVALGAASFRLF